MKQGGVRSLGPPKRGDASGESGGLTSLATRVVYPERPERAGVVIVIHEIFGMTDWVRAVADRPAAENFIAPAPDLLSGKGPGGGGIAG